MKIQVNVCFFLFSFVANAFLDFFLHYLKVMQFCLFLDPYLFWLFFLKTYIFFSFFFLFFKKLISTR